MIRANPKITQNKAKVRGVLKKAHSNGSAVQLTYVCMQARKRGTKHRPIVDRKKKVEPFRSCFLIRRFFFLAVIVAADGPSRPASAKQAGARFRHITTSMMQARLCQCSQTQNFCMVIPPPPMWRHARTSLSLSSQHLQTFWSTKITFLPDC